MTIVVTYQFSNYKGNPIVNKVIYNSYNPLNYYQCFKFIGLSTAKECDGYRTDIAQIELFGDFISDNIDKSVPADSLTVLSETFMSLTPKLIEAKYNSLSGVCKIT